MDVEVVQLAINGNIITSDKEDM